MMNLLKSDLYKLKGTWVPWAHGLVPLLYGLAFYGAYRTTGLGRFSDLDLLQTYLVLMGVALPPTSALVTGQVSHMEAEAGHFQILLTSTPFRAQAYLTKVLVSLLGLAVSLALALLVWVLLMGKTLGGLAFYGGLLLFLASLFSYLVHLDLALFVESGASMGLGFFGSLLALLATTGLGDGLWYALPPTWPSRLAGTLVLAEEMGSPGLFCHELTLWALLALPLTLIVLAASLLAFSKWEGGSFSA
ncbi:MAG: lantibiotic immunity ABC transporter MutG family permease subunit [Tissierellia bacterium]|nr:lantibiotic immunity ABC transporter MutG family permease subunit [Tissierellia bacterium]